MTPEVTRAHLKRAIEESAWDRLDRLLEIDASKVDDRALFTDGWGEWWGPLVECVRRREAAGVRVLLAHGADPGATTWGDGMPATAEEMAERDPEILALLRGEVEAVYERTTDPPLPEPTARDDAVDRQGEVRDATGLVFPHRDE